ncbi:MAG: hypothetical protein ACYDEJ_07920 [Desulfitobacteriaceae bacterium]
MDKSQITQGMYVKHLTKGYIGQIQYDGITKIKAVFEDQSDDEEYRIITKEGIKIASLKNLIPLSDIINNATFHSLCHNCKEVIHSKLISCPKCHWYICNKCGQCGCHYWDKVKSQK